MNNRTLALFLIAILYASGTFCIPKVQFVIYTIDNGLSHNYISSIYQDKEGFIWVGTRNGINIYDGYSFEKHTSAYTDENTILRGVVTSIIEDDFDRIWIGTLGSGLCYYDKRKKVFKRFPTETFRSVDVITLLINKNELWIGHRNGIDILNINTKEVFINERLDSALNGKMVNELYMASNNNILIGSEGKGLFIYNTTTLKIKNYAYLPNHNSISDNTVNSIYEDKNGVFWIGTTNEGLNKFDIKTETFEVFNTSNNSNCPISNNKVWAITTDVNDNLWIGTDNGLNIFNPDNGCFEQINYNPNISSGLSDNRILCLFQDKYGIMWVGSRMGLNKLVTNKFVHYSRDPQKNSLFHNNVHCFAESSDGNIWIGTSQGLDRFNPVNEKFAHINNLIVPVLCIDVDVNNDIWLGTWKHGLFQYKPENDKVLSFSKDIIENTNTQRKDIFALKSDKKNNLWIGTWGAGLLKYNKKTGKVTEYSANPNNVSSISNNFICQILLDSNDSLWIATQDGINKLIDDNEGIFTRFYIDKVDSTISGSNFITCMYKSSQYCMWVSTLNGIHKLNTSTGEVASYYTNDGLASNVTTSIVSDNNDDIWVGTNNGLSRFMNNDTNNVNSVPQIVNYYKEDGLQGNDFLDRSVLKTSRGLIFMGGSNGFNVFYPEAKTNISNIPPNIVFTGLDIHNKPIEIGETVNNTIILSESISKKSTIELSKKNNFVTVHFSGLHFKDPNRNIYKYKLENIDEDWHLVNANNRSATYTNLNGGSYTLKVLAANSDGVWTKTPKTLNINIIPPIWERLWFQISLIIILIIATIAILRWRFYLLKKQQVILEEKIKDRTKEINSQNTILEEKNVKLNQQKEELVKQKKEISEQSVQIRQMNELLKKHNIELKDNLESLSKARVMQKMLTYDEFLKIYPDDLSCLKLVASVKWANGFTCKKCKHHEYTEQEDTFMRRCKKCFHKESATSGTIFHKLKFSINKALYILILTSSEHNLNVSQLSKDLSLRLNTCWSFHLKVQHLINTAKNFKMTKNSWRELILVK